jgi:hypothetical protein
MTCLILCNLKLRLLMAINVLSGLFNLDAICGLLKILRFSLLTLMRIYLTLLILNHFNDILLYLLYFMYLHKVDCLSLVLRLFYFSI